MIKKDIEILQKHQNQIEKDLLDPEDITNKFIDLEDRPRRNNLCIDDIKEINNDSWENCEQQEKLNIEKNIQIDRCHRAGKKHINHPRTTFCRITKFKVKQLILKNSNKLKNSIIYICIYEDFSRDTMELRKQLWEDVLEYCRQGNYAYLNFISIVVRDHVR